MSRKYSNSPALHLRIAESQICRALQLAFICACLGSAFLIYLRGYPLLAALAGILVLLNGRALFRQPLAGAAIGWSQGQWTLQQGSQERLIYPSSACRVTPWALYFCWRQQAGPSGSVWLYRDSGSSQALRRLRVRLTLERGIGRSEKRIPGLR